MAEPTVIDIEYTREDNEPFAFQLNDADGNALNVSGSTFTMTVNTESDADSATSSELFTLTGTFLTDGTDGRILFTPTSVNTDLDADVYFYDVQQDTPTRRTIIRGELTILTQVTTT